MRSLELKIPPVAQVIIIAIFMWLLSLVSTTFSFQIPWKTQVATVLGTLGIVISILGVIEFRRANTTADPRIPHQTTRLVNSGIYQLSRNPMYLGFVFILTGWSFYLSHGLSFLLLPAFVLYINRFQIVPEERTMLGKFGAEYSSYLSKVRRWI